jgi:hypothetical protein
MDMPLIVSERESARIQISRRLRVMVSRGHVTERKIGHAERVRACAWARGVETDLEMAVVVQRLVRTDL